MSPVHQQRPTDSSVTCSNCSTTENVATYSYDLDLPKIRLCRVCSVLIVTDPELFEELGRKRAVRPRVGR